jgi:hypothetical protein
MGIAVLRGVESEKPEGERILFDPYARQLVPGWLYALTKFFITTGPYELRQVIVQPGELCFRLVRPPLKQVTPANVQSWLHDLGELARIAEASPLSKAG